MMTNGYSDMSGLAMNVHSAVDPETITSAEIRRIVRETLEANRSMWGRFEDIDGDVFLALCDVVESAIVVRLA